MASKLFMLLVLLGALAGGGYWNYQRNLAKEEASKGPYAGYSDEQLAALAKAYEAEISKSGKRYAAEKGNRHQAKGGQYIDEQVKDYENAAARGRAIRDAGGDLSVGEATLRDIKAELSTRGGSQRDIFIRRLLTF